MNPVIRWAGSKRQLLPTLRQIWSDRTSRYVEPFCGSSCFFFDVEPASAVLGDINSELISTYRALRHDATRVAECLLRWPISKKTYLSLRAIEPESLSNTEAAARFLYL